MRLLGIDPGFAAVGIGVVEFQSSATRVLFHETYRTRTHDTDEERLDSIADRICDVIEDWRPDAIGYENQATIFAAKAHRKRESDDDQVNFANTRVLEMTGLIRAAARFNAVPCYVLAASTIKVAVLGRGGGRRKKPDVKAAVRTIFRLGNVSEHVADAIAIAVATRGKHREAQLVLASAASLIH